MPSRYGPRTSASGAFGRNYELVIESIENNKAVVSENSTNALLPKCCVERHINEDATFCLHFDSIKPIVEPDDVISWWNSLGDYLNHQDYSSRRRKWPIHAQLSHGEAAIAQLRMEELAEPLGWQGRSHGFDLSRKRMARRETASPN